MKKLFTLLTLSILLHSHSVIAQKTVLKGKVHNWVSDSVYITKLSFHSPHSSWTQSQKISQDSTFYFEWNNIKEPLVISISSLESFAKQTTEHLIYENYTPNHKMSYCLKFYENGSTIHFIEPGSTMEMELTSNTWFDKVSEKRAKRLKEQGAYVIGNQVRDYGKTEVKYVGESDVFQNYYFTNYPNQINKLEKAIDAFSSRNRNLAVVNLKNAGKHLEQELSRNKSKLSEDMIQYLESQIKYGVKKELFKYLILDQPEYVKKVIKSGDIDYSLAEMIAFDKEAVENLTYKTEMYAEYIEYYLNFIMSMEDKKFKNFREFDIEKFTFAMKELPLESAYFYVANNLLLLEEDKRNEFKEVVPRFLSLFSNGELNALIKEHFNLGNGM